MLSDIERKILRIIGNFSAGRRRVPTIDEICVKTGRERLGVMEVLTVLNRERYINWNPENPDRVELLEAWERKSLTRHVARNFDPKTSPFMN